jgi:hypothetical protein
VAQNLALTSATAAIHLKVYLAHAMVETAPGGDLEKIYRSGLFFTVVGCGSYLCTGWPDGLAQTLKMTNATTAIHLRVPPGHPIADTAPGGDLEKFYRSGLSFTEVGCGRLLCTGWPFLAARYMCFNVLKDVGCN